MKTIIDVSEIPEKPAPLFIVDKKNQWEEFQTAQIVSISIYRQQFDQRWYYSRSSSVQSSGEI